MNLHNKVKTFTKDLPIVGREGLSLSHKCSTYLMAVKFNKILKEMTNLLKTINIISYLFLTLSPKEEGGRIHLTSIKLLQILNSGVRSQ